MTNNLDPTVVTWAHLQRLPGFEVVGDLINRQSRLNRRRCYRLMQKHRAEPSQRALLRSAFWEPRQDGLSLCLGSRSQQPRKRTEQCLKSSTTEKVPSNVSMIG
jgi:hypothetical protein